jgi:hypothetical protein
LRKKNFSVNRILGNINFGMAGGEGRTERAVKRKGEGITITKSEVQEL